MELTTKMPHGSSNPVESFDAAPGMTHDCSPDHQGQSVVDVSCIYPEMISQKVVVKYERQYIALSGKVWNQKRAKTTGCIVRKLVCFAAFVVSSVKPFAMSSS